MNIKEIFGENLKRYRKMSGMTQEELSERLDITPNHLSRIENGKSFITAECLDSLCGIFKITPATLFYTSPEIFGDEILFSKIDALIDEETKLFSSRLKERIRK